jgi:transcription elongation factor Elf1
MNCPRCQGLLISDHLYNKDESLYVLSIWRCLNCGETFDSMIIRNRTNQGRKEVTNKPKISRWAGTRNSLVVPS